MNFFFFFKFLPRENRIGAQASTPVIPGLRWDLPDWRLWKNNDLLPDLPGRSRGKGGGEGVVEHSILDSVISSTQIDLEGISW